MLVNQKNPSKVKRNGKVNESRINDYGHQNQTGSIFKPRGQILGIFTIPPTWALLLNKTGLYSKMGFWAYHVNCPRGLWMLPQSP